MQVWNITEVPTPKHHQLEPFPYTRSLRATTFIQLTSLMSSRWHGLALDLKKKFLFLPTKYLSDPLSFASYLCCKFLLCDKSLELQRYTADDIQEINFFQTRRVLTHFCSKLLYNPTYLLVKHITVITFTIKYHREQKHDIRIWCQLYGIVF